MESILIDVLNMSLTASVMILAILLVRIPLKKAPRIYTYALWAIVLFRLLCPVSFESGISLLGVLQNESAVKGRMEYISQDIGYQMEPQINMPIEAANEVVNSSLQAGNPQGSVNPMQIILYLAVRIWILGIAAILIYSAVSLWKLKKRLKSAVWERDNIYRMPGNDSPFVYGIFSPCIYLPKDLNEEELEYMLLHEQIHIRRGDNIYRLLAYLALCIHWFNPLVWAAFSISGKDMEISCDEAVIRKLGSGVKKKYSASLLNMAHGSKVVKGIPLAFGESDTGSRIKHVLKYKKPAKTLVTVVIAVCGILAVALLGNPVEKGYFVYGVIGYADMQDMEGRMQRVVTLINGDVSIPGTDEIIPYKDAENTDLEIGDLIKIKFAEPVGILETYPGQFDKKAKSIEVLGKGYSLESQSDGTYLLSTSLDSVKMADIGDELEIYQGEKLLSSAEIVEIEDETNRLYLELEKGELETFFKNYEAGITYQLVVQENVSIENEAEQTISSEFEPQNPEDGTYYINIRSISKNARCIDRYVSDSMNEEQPMLNFVDYCVFLVNTEMNKERYEVISFDEFADLVNNKEEFANAPCIVTFENGMIVEAKLENVYFNYGITYQPYTGSGWEALFADIVEEHGQDLSEGYAMAYNVIDTIEYDVGDGRGDETIEVCTGNNGADNFGSIHVRNAQGKIIYSDAATQSRAGWNNIYLGEADGIKYMLRMTIEDRDTYGAYDYQVFRLDRYGEILQIAGTQFEWGDNYTYDDGLFKEWVSELEFYLERSFLLLSSQEGEIRIEHIGEADKYNYETLKRE